MRMQRTFFSLAAMLWTVALASPASAQESKIEDGTLLRKVASSPTSAEQMRSSLLDIVRFQQALLPSLPDPSGMQAYLAGLEGDILALSDDELDGFSLVVSEVPGWDRMLEKIRSLNLPNSTDSGETSTQPASPGPGESPGPRPQLEDYFYGGPGGFFSSEVEAAAFLVWEAAGGVQLVAQAICDGSPSGCLCPANAVSCTVAGIAGAVEWGANVFRDEISMVNGNTTATNVQNLILYAQSLHDLTSDNFRYTDDSELKTQTDTLIAEINENQRLLEKLGEASCEIIRLLNTPQGLRSSQLDMCSSSPGWPYDFPGTGVGSQGADAAGPQSGPNTLYLEQALAEGRILPSLYLPASSGGLIDKVQNLVWTTIENQRSVGYAALETEQAVQKARTADGLLAEKRYADAYRAYSAGFQELIPAPTGGQKTGAAEGNPGGDRSSLEPGAVALPTTTPLPLLSAPRPNPTTGRISYSINLSVASQVRVRVFDVSGKLVEDLLNTRLDAGTHEMEWDPDTMRKAGAAGVYFLSLDAGTLHASRQFVLVR